MREREDAMENGVSKKISVLDITNEMRREAEKQLAFCTHVRSEGRRDEVRVVTLMRRERGVNATVACTCALLPYTTRSYGVFLHVCALVYAYTSTFVYDRISTGETNSISGTVCVRPSVRSSVRLYVCPRTNDLETALRGEVN